MEHELKRKVAWLIASRALIGTVLMGGATAVQVTRPGSFPVDPFFFLIALIYGLTSAYALALRIAGGKGWLVDFQLAFDGVLVSAFIYLTGGVTSVFSVLYVLPIVAASLLRMKRGGLLAASWSTLLFVALVVVQFLAAAGPLAGWWTQPPSVVLPSGSIAGYIVALNICGFFGIAFLTGSLAEHARAAGARLEQASTEIADLQALNQHVIDSLPSGLMTTDPMQRVLSFNHAAENICGLPFQQVLGRQATDVLQLPPRLVDALNEGLKAGGARRLEFRYRRPNGHEIDIGLSATHLETPGGRAGYLVTFQDLTDIKRLEREARLQQRLAAVGEMAAGIAHEIRNPLASMSGSIQILRQELALSSEQEQLMDIVLRESERLNTTIRSFLAYARPQRFAITRFDVRRAINDAALLLRNSAEVQEGHTIDVELTPEPLWYEADEGQIKQIVWNLASNGLRAMPSGGRLLLTASTDKDYGVLIGVKDEGIGIPPEEIEGMFQPFHGTFARGSGLGLSIVHRIVTDYRGEIQVRSRKGEGTLVLVRLPVRIGGDRMNAAESQPVVAPPETGKARILVVDDEQSMRELLAIVLRREGYEVLLAENGKTAIDIMSREPIELLISDIKMPDMSGVEVLRAAKRLDPGILGIMITAFASTETAVEAMRLGACDYLSKPFDVDLLRMKVREKIENRQLRQENVLLKRTLGLSHQFANIIGRSESMLDVFKMIETVARTNSTILLTGESGTGKGLVAQAVHFHSLRRDKPMVSLNCGAMPENLLESELFGHMRGAFTGADQNKKGLLEAAEKGTIFLDEIGEMSAVMQVKLLRVLQERKFRRVGGLEELTADIRVVAATNQDLTRAVAEGRFREDLFYRINVIPIVLPPLRDRREDIPLIAEHFLSKYAEQMDKPVIGIAAPALDLLMRYEWPGNIRELENVLERAVALEATPLIMPESLPPTLLRGGPGVKRAVPVGGELPDAGFDLEAHVTEIERGFIAEALQRAGGVQVKAAELLGMSFRSFRYYVKKYNLR